MLTTNFSIKQKHVTGPTERSVQPGRDVARQSVLRPGGIHR